MVTARDVPMAPHRWDEHKAIVEKVMSPLEMQISRAYPHQMDMEGDVKHLVSLMERLSGKEADRKVVRDAAVRIFLEDQGVTLSQHDDFDVLARMIISRVQSYPKGWLNVLGIKESVNEKNMDLTMGERLMCWVKRVRAAI